MIQQLTRIAGLSLSAMLFVASMHSVALAEPDSHAPLQLGGFFKIDVANLGLQPSTNATDALWQLFRSNAVDERDTLSIRTKYNLGTAVVDLKIEGVEDQGIHAIFYRAIIEKSRRGWVVTHLGRKHRCGRLGMSVVPIWTTLPCP